MTPLLFKLATSSVTLLVSLVEDTYLLKRTFALPYTLDSVQNSYSIVFHILIIDLNSVLLLYYSHNNLENLTAALNIENTGCVHKNTTSMISVNKLLHISHLP